ncbi:cytochrome P450 [Streptomyces sp. NPDC059003]|uniref:cytochrome P450 n=1 Tax=Streptomyces sp. NPDC059003 TaxID=3346691 RepID=UPI00368154F8
MIKTAPGVWPVLGHTPRLIRDPLAFVASLPAHGDLVEIRIATQKVIVVCDPELTRQLLTSDRVFDKGGDMFDRLREVTGNGLGGCPHSDHRRQRRAVQPAFHVTRIPVYAAAMTRQSSQLTDSWHDGQRINVLQEMLNLTGRITISTLFSDAISASQLTTALADVRTVMAGIFWRMIMPNLLNAVPTPRKIRYDRARARLRRLTRQAIAERRASTARYDDLISMVIYSQPTDSTQLSDAEIEDQVMTFFLGGVETTANSLAWTFHLLARHPDVLHRLHTEVDSVLAGRAATIDDLPNLPFTGRIVTESLRLYPPGWFLSRTATTDTQLGGARIPAGTIMAYSPYLVHRKPEDFTDPDRFDPDRWDDHTSALASRSLLIPFSAGPRKCIGDTYAMTEACIALATISSRITLEPLTARPVRAAVDPQLHPRKLALRVATRHHRSGPPPE